MKITTIYGQDAKKFQDGMLIDFTIKYVEGRKVVEITSSEVRRHE